MIEKRKIKIYETCARELEIDGMENPNSELNILREYLRNGLTRIIKNYSETQPEKLGGNK